LLKIREKNNSTKKSQKYCWNGREKTRTNKQTRLNEYEDLEREKARKTERERERVREFQVMRTRVL
jgi:hypothetical protein